MSKKKPVERKLPHNIGTRAERMKARRFEQRRRLPLWAVGLLVMFGGPEIPNPDFWNERRG